MNALGIVLTRRNVRGIPTARFPRRQRRESSRSRCRLPSPETNHLAFHRHQRPGHPLLHPGDQSLPRGFFIILAAIIVCAYRSPLPEKPNFRIQSCAAATENILLAAHALGLGAIWTAVYPDANRMLGFANHFSLPDDVVPFALVTIGYPAVRPRPRPLPRGPYPPEPVIRGHWR